MSVESYDVIIIGAGLSGIGAACHLTRLCPNKTYAVLEGRDALGGTWDLFRYPGIRSDSDMFTFGYKFKPWEKNNPIAEGEDILNYLKDAAQEYNVLEHIRYQHKVTKANWNSETKQWELTIDHNGKEKRMNANFMMGCTGYYNYAKGHTPNFEGQDQFKGKIIHPQFWPEDADYNNKKVVVIGSGATAITLVPAMADKTAHITLLQRSPSYVMGLPQKDPMLNLMRRLKLPEKLVYGITRLRNICLSVIIYLLCQIMPKKMTKFIQWLQKRELPEGFDLKHFTPSYNPWDERLCVTPDNVFFHTIRDGKASIVTDHIAQFTKTGIALKSGEHLDADIIVTATGLEMQMLGNMAVYLDGELFDTQNKMGYRGILFEDLPNASATFGYTNASWTLKSDMTTEYVCKIINYMDKNGLKAVKPVNKEKGITHLPFLDMQSGYVQRAIDKLPKQGHKMPWRVYQNYFLDYFVIKTAKMNDGVLEFK